MGKREEEFEISFGYHNVISNKPDYESFLNARDWLEIVFYSLDSCKALLKTIARKNQKNKTLIGFLNCGVEGGEDSSERRITSEEIIRNLPKKFQVNRDEWLLIPIKLLEKSEKKGLFLERRLFIVADTADLLIMDIKFYKIPQPDQSSGTDLPKINEIVSSVVLTESGQEKKEDAFLDLALPYFHKTDLGKNIIQYHLNDVISEIRELAEIAEEARKQAKDFIQIRERLGIYNNLKP